MSRENDFFQGKFEAVIKSVKINSEVLNEQISKQISEHDAIYLIGAYCFSGQPDEAERVLSKRKIVDSRAYFFLGLGYTRNSDYKKARTYFGKLQKIAQTEWDYFLLSQGMSFFNFFICRYKIAERWIKHAGRLVKDINQNLFWELIYLDLASHIYVRRGKINLALKFLADAHSIAKKIGNKFSEEATAVATVVYDSIYGLDQKASLANLEKLIEQYKNSKGFYFYNLNLEYIRRLNLSGELLTSEKRLRSIEKDLFATSLKRQKATWAFRYAHLLFLQGKSDQCLHQIESALDYVDSRQDLSLRVQILGLKYKLYELLDYDSSDLVSEIKKITFYCQDSQALSYAYRYGWLNKPVNEDPYAQFFHAWKRQGHKNYAALKKVVDKKWVSLFADIVPANRQNYMYLDFLPKKAILLTENNIKIIEGLTPLIRQALLILNKGRTSKKEFVELLWGYQYDSYRHDSLIYTVVSRMREILGEHADLLVMKSNYLEVLQMHVRVYEHEFVKRQDYTDSEISIGPSDVGQPDTRQSDIGQPDSQGLNYRQIEILEYLSNHKYVDVTTASKFLQSTKLTASRDLSDLFQKNRVCKTGKARATRYSLK